MKAQILCLLIATVFFASIVFTISPIYAATATTYMRVSPSSILATLNETFSISVIIENVQGMYGYQFYLYWNKSFLENTQGYNSTSKTWVQDPNTPPSVWGSNIFVGKNEIANMTDGRSRYYLVLVATPPAPTANGTFSVVTLNFKVIGTGQTSLDLDKTKIGDQFAIAIPHTVVDGSFKTILRDVEVINVEPKSRKIVQNETVEIEVEVKNNGNIPENFTVATYYNSTTSVVGLVGTQNVVNLAPSTSQTLTFDWNTTGVEIGDYNIFANASFLEKELNMTNNQLVDGTIEITGEVIRDLAITSFTANMTIIAEGENVAIKVIVKNFGLVNENNINLTLYYNTTLLERFTFSPITAGSKKEHSLNWNTTEKAGYYILKANITIVPNEEQTTDNEKTLDLIITKAPIANFTISPATPTVNKEVTFNASASYDPDGWIANYTWDFGDSTYLGYGALVTHRYTKGGVYKVTLIVKDNVGLTYSASRVLTYPSRTEKNVTIQGIAVSGLVPQDIIYYAVIAIISIAVLAVIYTKFPRKPKEQKQK